MTDRPVKPHRSGGGVSKQPQDLPLPRYDNDTGYFCVVCNRLILSEGGVFVHDNVQHPASMTFNESENPQ